MGFWLVLACLRIHGRLRSEELVENFELIKADFVPDPEQNLYLRY